MAQRKTDFSWQQRSNKQRRVQLQNIAALYGNAQPVDLRKPAQARKSSRSGKPVVQKECDIQIRFVTWLSSLGFRCNHSPNEGKRSPILGAKLRRMGVSRGFPDIEIPIPIKPYHGFYIELKRIGGKLTQEQQEWLEYLRAQGYYAEAAYGLTHAQQLVANYIALDPTKPRVTITTANE